MTPQNDSDTLLSVTNLRIEALMDERTSTTLVDGVSFEVPRGKVTAIVGESGSGKTLTATAVMGLLPPHQLRIRDDSSIRFEQQELVGCADEVLRAHRGSGIAMIFQEPGSCLNPVITLGEQLCFPLLKYKGLTKSEARERAVELLAEVGIASPEERLRSFPHELSGGQQQRVMIAMALACEPKLLIADEPTSALDVTIQRQILDLLARLRQSHDMTLLLITHDLGLVGEIADRVIVFHNGVIKEQGEKHQILHHPENSYTRNLIASRARLTAPSTGGSEHPDTDLAAPEHLGQSPLLVANNLNKNYAIRTGMFRQRCLSAVKDVSFALAAGETLGIVGQSGSGKTTLAKMLARLIEANSGQVQLADRNILSLKRAQMRDVRRQIQIVFQNPYGSLNPRWTIRKTLLSPMMVHGLGASAGDREEQAGRLLESVGLSRSDLDNYPDQFSGGERQRIAIARALAVQPSILICDEVVSALDVTVQAQVLDLLKQLQREYGIAYLFISHDLAAVRYMGGRVLVMKEGEIVEKGYVSDVFSTPNHSYTASLLAAQSQVVSPL